MAEQLVPRCNLWGVINPHAPQDEWRRVRCDRPDGHRGYCYAQRRELGSVRFYGMPKPEG